MAIYEIKCPTKVTLFMNYTGMNDGKPKFNTIYDTVDAYNTLTVFVSANTKTISKFHGLTEEEEHHLKRVSEIFFNYTNINGYHVSIDVQKNDFGLKELDSISGLAAGLIKILNSHFKLDLSNKDLLEIAYKCGPTVPYFMIGGKVLVNDEGEIIPLTENNCEEYLLAIPKIINNDSAYKELIRNEPISITDIDSFLGHNDLEIYSNDELLEIKKSLSSNGAKVAVINGLGPSVIASFRNNHERFLAKKGIEDRAKVKFIKPANFSKIAVRY